MDRAAQAYSIPGGIISGSTAVREAEIPEAVSILNSALGELGSAFDQLKSHLLPLSVERPAQIGKEAAPRPPQRTRLGTELHDQINTVRRLTADIHDQIDRLEV